MVVNIKDIIERTKEKEEKRVENIEKQIDNALKGYSGVGFLEKQYFELKFPLGLLNDRIAGLIVDRYKENNPDIEIDYKLVNENDGLFYKFSFKLIK